MRKPVVIHPLLFAVYPILFLYAHNRKEMSANQIFMVLGVSIGLAVLLWALFGLLLKDRAKAGLATSLGLFVLLTYGHFYGLLKNWDVFVPGHQYLLPGALLALGYCVYFIHRAQRGFVTVTRMLNVAAFVMISMNLFTIGSYQIALARLPGPAPQPVATEQVVQREANHLPDIYFILLDEYGSPDAVKEHYGYDNEPFMKSLEKKGFYIARNSTMHNEETVRAIASILNMEFTPESEEPEISYQRIVSNEVVTRLRSLGYRYVYFGQWYEQDRYEIQADEKFNYYEMTGPMTAEFSATLWDTTILSPFFGSIAGEQYEGYYRDGVLRTLDHLGRIAEAESPKFVFAHIMVPHAPFVFGPDGERVAPENFYNFDDNEYYLGQYIYITREIDKVLDKVLKNSAIEPIIILQSDHGPRWVDGWERILNTYHLPGDGRELLQSAVSPVNTFRIIFNHYFGANYEMLEDMER